METIGIGIAGTGFVADLHARVYQTLGNLGIKIVGVTSRTPIKREAFARRHGIDKTVPNFGGLLEMDEVDIVDLCVPNDLHKVFSLQAAEAGKHIICEKPLTGYFGDGQEPRREMLAGALTDANAMVKAAEEHNVKLMYGENWLYSPVIQKAKRLVKASGGTIFEIRGEESHHGSHASYVKSWRNTGGGSLIRLGAHPIGAILHLKWWEGICREGQPIAPRSVVASVANLTRIPSFQQHGSHWIVSDWEDVENWATAILTFSDGSKAIVTASDVCLGGIKDTLDIFMSNARIHCDFSRSNLLQAYAPDPTVFEEEYLTEKLETKAGWSFPSVDEEWLMGYQNELQDFIEAVKFDRAPMATARLGRDVVEVIYSAYISAEEGCVVELNGII